MYIRRLRQKQVGGIECKRGTQLSQIPQSQAVMIRHAWMGRNKSKKQEYMYESYQLVDGLRPNFDQIHDDRIDDIKLSNCQVMKGKPVCSKLWPS